MGSLGKRLAASLRKLVGLEYDSSLIYSDTFRFPSPASQKAAQVPRQEEERKFHIAYYPRDPRRRGGVLTTATQEQAAAAVATSSDVDPSLPVTARKIVRWQQGILVDDSARMSK